MKMLYSLMGTTDAFTGLLRAFNHSGEVGGTIALHPQGSASSFLFPQSGCCLQDKHAEIEAKRDPGIDDILLALKEGTVNDVVATQVHIMLRSNLTARKKWLAGMPLQQALLESSSSPRSPRSVQTPIAPTICEDREYNHAECLVV